jgi:hypothetical protein
MYSHIQSTYAVVQGRELISSAALVAFSVLSNTCPQRPFANSVDCSVAVRWTNDDWKISTRHAWREVIQNMIITLAVNVTECGDIVALGICSERFGQREYIQTPIRVDWPFGNKARQNDKFEIAGPAYNAPGNPLYVALDISPEGTMSASLIQIIPLGIASLSLSLSIPKSGHFIKGRNQKATVACILRFILTLFSFSIHVQTSQNFHPPRIFGLMSSGF